MARPPRCPHTRAHAGAGAAGAPPPEGLAPLRSTDAAIELVATALGPGHHRAALVPLDAQRRGSRVICVDHVPSDDAVLEVLELTLEAHARGASALAALVLGTRRVSVLGWPAADDWWRYGAALERCEAAGVLLLDWVLVGDHGAVSLAELDGRAEARWDPA